MDIGCGPKESSIKSLTPDIIVMEPDLWAYGSGVMFLTILVSGTYVKVKFLMSKSFLFTIVMLRTK